MSTKTLLAKYNVEFKAKSFESKENFLAQLAILLLCIVDSAGKRTFLFGAYDA
jgi:hypothetical protein